MPCSIMSHTCPLIQTFLAKIFEIILSANHSSIEAGCLTECNIYNTLQLPCKIKDKVHLRNRYLASELLQLFDLFADKAQVWLARNQNDPGKKIGWVRSKYLIRLKDRPGSHVSAVTAYRRFVAQKARENIG